MSEPQTIVKICRNVPWDDTYRHLRRFSSKEEQESYFSSKTRYRLTQYSYVRENSSDALRVEINQDDLRDCNYMCYWNGNDWHYNFITDVVYLAEGTSLINFVEDWYQTWQFAFNIKPCFIEREHTVSDNIGEHIISEGIDSGDHISTARQNYLAAKNHFFLYASNINASTWIALRDSGYTRDRWKQPGEGDNLYSACHIIDVGENPADIDAITKIFADNGQLDSVVGVYNLPVEVDRETDITILRPSVLNGYTPRNKKLLTYPYLYIEASTSGQKGVYAYEDFDGLPEFRPVLPIIPGSNGFMIPTNYKLRGYGALSDASYSLVLGDSLQPGWRGNTFANYMANHALSTAMGFVGGAVSIISGMQGVNTAISSNKFRKAAHVGKPHPVLYNRMLADELYSAVDSFTSGAIGTATNMIANMENIAEHSSNSNKIEATQSCSSLTNKDGYAVFFNVMASKPEFLAIIDNFFDVYGYKVNRLGTPNLDSRPSWNYIQTDNAVVTGNAPSDALANFANVLDKGVTFWHTNDVGNYSLDNSIGGNQ